jgi:hypothetical protein
LFPLLVAREDRRDRLDLRPNIPKRLSSKKANRNETKRKEIRARLAVAISEILLPIGAGGTYISLETRSWEDEGGTLVLLLLAGRRYL